MKESKKDKIIGRIFITWFILSLLSLLVVGELGMNHLVFFIFGQYFLLFSCVAFYSKEAIPPSFIFYIVGLGCIIGSIISKNYEKLKIITSDFSYRNHIYLMITILVFVLNFIFLLLHIFTKKTKKYYYIFIMFLIIFVLLALCLCI